MKIFSSFQPWWVDFPSAWPWFSPLLFPSCPIASAPLPTPWNPNVCNPTRRQLKTNGTAGSGGAITSLALFRRLCMSHHWRCYTLFTRSRDSLFLLAQPSDFQPLPSISMVPWSCPFRSRDQTRRSFEACKSKRCQPNYSWEVRIHRRKGFSGDDFDSFPGSVEDIRRLVENVIFMFIPTPSHYLKMKVFCSFIPDTIKL